jgi:hypothetical protein
VSLMTPDEYIDRELARVELHAEILDAGKAFEDLLLHPDHAVHGPAISVLVDAGWSLSDITNVLAVFKWLRGE